MFLEPSVTCVCVRTLNYIREREEEPELFYVILCSDLMEKVCFSGSIISLISSCE